MSFLLDHGYAYMGNSLADDVPHYWVKNFEERRAILTMPHYYHFDDQFFLMFPQKGTGLENPGAFFEIARGNSRRSSSAAGSFA